MSASDGLRILFVVDGFGIGGAEAGAMRLARALREMAPVRLDVCSTRRDDRLYAEFLRSADRVYRFPRQNRLALGTFARLVALMGANRYDVVQTALFYADVLGVPAARLCGVPCIISWQTALGARTGYAQDDLLRHRVSLRMVSRICTTMVAVSEDLRRSFVRRGLCPADRILTIHYGIDTDEFRPDDAVRARARGTLGLRDGQIAIGAMGHFNPVKNHRLLVEAFAAVRRSHRNCILLLAGDGQERANLERLAKELGVADSVKFVGYYRPSSEFLNALDVYVHPSLQEGLPNAVIEAMATGKPVLGSRAGGIPEIVEEGVTGFLFDPRSSEQLAELLERVCSSGSLRENLSKAGRERALKHFSLHTEARKFLELYEGLLRKRRGPGSRAKGDGSRRAGEDAGELAPTAALPAEARPRNGAECRTSDACASRFAVSA